MKTIKIKRQALFANRGKSSRDLAAIHRCLSESERCRLSFVRTENEQQLKISLKNPNADMTVGQNQCVFNGTADAKNIDLLMRFCAIDGERKITVDADSETAQQVWTAAQNYALVVKNIVPDAERIEKEAAEIKKLQPIGEFFAHAEEISLHKGVSSPKKPSVGERFLNVLKNQKGKLLKAMAPVAKFYNKHKTITNLTGMSVGFLLMGPIGTTLYSQIDKARRAHEKACGRRIEEKNRLAKLAAFAEKGLKIPDGEKNKVRKNYVRRPYIRFAGHLATRLGATVALTAVAGSLVGLTASAIITAGKTVYDTHLLQDLLLKTVGKKPKTNMPLRERLHKSIQTAAGIEIDQQDFYRTLNKLKPANWFKNKQRGER